MEKLVQVCKVATYLPISSLVSHPRNIELRSITRERLDDLKTSIVNKGFYEPVLVWRKNNWILSGNHRVKAAVELIKDGYAFFGGPDGSAPFLPVVYTECDEATANAILFETNNQYADWVQDKLEVALQEAERAGASLKSYGFTQEQVDKMVKASLKEAEEVLDRTERIIEPVDSDRLAKAVGEPEYMTLSFEKEVGEQFLGILEKTAKKINEDWSSGDSYTEALQIVCQTLHEALVDD